MPSYSSCIQNKQIIIIKKTQQVNQQFQNHYWILIILRKTKQNKNNCDSQLKNHKSHQIV